MRPRPARTLAVTACLAALIPLLVACGGSEGDGALQVGDVVPARLADQFEGGRHAMVAVPTGRLRIWTDPAADSVDRKDTRQLQAIDAPSGATLIPMTWKFLDDFADAQPFIDTDARPTVDLLTDGESYRLPTPSSSDPEGESFYVAVDGDGSQLSLKVAFDGVSQTVDLRTGKREAGRAEALYGLDPQRQRPQDCGHASWEDPELNFPDYSCAVTTRLLLPYADGRWAPDGQQFLAVEVRTRLKAWNLYTDVTGTAGAAYVGSNTHLGARLDDAKPVEVLDDPSVDCPASGGLDCDAAGFFVYLVDARRPATTLDVEQTFRLSLASDFGDAHPDSHTTGDIKSAVRVDLP